MKCKALVVMMLLSVAGCGSELANISGGIIAGGALSNTIAGAEKDLEAREAKLIERYNKGVEIGAQKEYLDQIEKEIYDTRLGKQTLSTGKKLFDIDWQDPKAAGGAIGLIGTLAYAYFKRKDFIEVGNKYSAAKIGMDKFRNENPDKAKELFADVGEARKAKKIA